MCCCVPESVCVYAGAGGTHGQLSTTLLLISSDLKTKHLPNRQCNLAGHKSPHPHSPNHSFRGHTPPAHPHHCPPDHPPPAHPHDCPHDHLTTCPATLGSEGPQHPMEVKGDEFGSLQRESARASHTCTRAGRFILFYFQFQRFWPPTIIE